jgi:hypothetical protein
VEPTYLASRIKDKTRGMKENRAARKRAVPSCSLLRSKIRIIPRNGMKIIKVRIGKFMALLFLL